MSKKIWLTQGQFALVDDVDYEELNQYLWFADYNLHTDSYYARRNKQLLKDKRIAIRMHREILGLGLGDNRQGDHINHNTLNNCRSNLRVVTHRQNLSNLKRETSSIYSGVTWDESKGKWLSRIYFNYKYVFLGRYEIELDAYRAYVKFAEEHGIKILRVA